MKDDTFVDIIIFILAAIIGIANTIEAKNEIIHRLKTQCTAIAHITHIAISLYNIFIAVIFTAISFFTCGVCVLLLADELAAAGL